MTLTVLTLNLRSSHNRWQERFPLVIETLLQTAPDVIGLQEVDLNIRQSEVIAAELNRQAGDAIYCVFTAPKWRDQPDEAVALLTRCPVTAYEHHNLPGYGRVAQRVDLMLDGQPVRVVNTHLHHRPIENESIRLPQMQQIMAWLTAHDRLQGCIVMGDLNSLPESDTLQATAPALTGVFTAPVVTFPTPLRASEYPGVAIQIDHILYDARTLRPVEARVVANESHPDDVTLYPSDHYGVLARFESGKFS